MDRVRKMHLKPAATRPFSTTAARAARARHDGMLTSVATAKPANESELRRAQHAVRRPKDGQGEPPRGVVDVACADGERRRGARPLRLRARSLGVLKGR